MVKNSGMDRKFFKIIIELFEEKNHINIFWNVISLNSISGAKQRIVILSSMIKLYYFFYSSYNTSDNTTV